MVLKYAFCTVKFINIGESVVEVPYTLRCSSLKVSSTNCTASTLLITIITCARASISLDINVHSNYIPLFCDVEIHTKFQWFFQAVDWKIIFVLFSSGITLVSFAQAECLLFHCCVF